MLKRCFKCEQEKPRGEFYKHPQMGDGLLGKCRECTRRDVVENRKKRLDYYREYDRQRMYDPARVAVRRAYAASPIGQAKRKRAGKAWLAKHTTEHKAQTAVHNAVRDGRLTKEPCAVCGTVERVQGHHEDYSKPLEVVWLCTKHHAERHKIIRRELRERARSA